MKQITLSFRGQTYVIPETKAFQVGERIEEIVTLAELASWGSSPRFFKIARCYGEMLRFAGAKVSDADVHSEIMGQIKAMGEAGQDQAGELVAVQAIGNLIEILMDGAPEGDADPEKKTPSSATPTG